MNTNWVEQLENYWDTDESYEDEMFLSLWDEHERMMLKNKEEEE